jgi:hypothetical protein
MNIHEKDSTSFDKNALIFVSSQEPDPKQLEHPLLDYSIIKEEDEVMYETNQDNDSLNLSKEFSKISENRLKP